MKSRKIYEYVVVKAEWFGNLDKGTRLYYDYPKNGYVYHYESNSTDSNNRYSRTSSEVIDYYMSLSVAEDNIAKDNLEVGPELGELEIK